MHELWQRLISIDHWFERYRLPIILIALVVVLRIPTFFEPYWYGDEGIYLVLGEALNRGKVLYAEIIDHKTPLIYVFAQVGSQLQFRLLMLGWLIAATAAYIYLSKQLFTKKASWVLASLGWITAISLPAFEGTIPNGELFVIGFVLLGVLCLLQTRLLRGRTTHLSAQTIAWIFAAGASFGLGILTKVPAILDLGAWLAIIAIFQLPTPFKLLAELKQRLLPTAGILTILGIGAVVPVLLSVCYFILRGHGQAYLDYGLLYNFRYAGTWQPNFPHPVFSLMFSLPGKTVVLAATLGVTWLLSAKLPKYLTIGLVWFWCALFASLLSNRPYPHYFLQVVPPLALFLGSVVELCTTKTQQFVRILGIATHIPVVVALIGVVVLLEVRPYPTISYYQNWWRYMTGQQSLQSYNQWFNPLMADNYQAAKLIRAQGNGQLFIWGTNPMLYALSDTIPTGRFTVSFHIHDFKAYDETIQSIHNAQPPFIVRMHDERATLPGLQQLLQQQYRLYRSFDNYDLWKRNATL